MLTYFFIWKFYFSKKIKQLVCLFDVNPATRIFYCDLQVLLVLWMIVKQFINLRLFVIIKLVFKVGLLWLKKNVLLAVEPGDAFLRIQEELVPILSDLIVVMFMFMVMVVGFIRNWVPKVIQEIIAVESYQIIESLHYCFNLNVSLICELERITD